MCVYVCFVAVVVVVVVVVVVSSFVSFFCFVTDALAAWASIPPFRRKVGFHLRGNRKEM